MINLQDNFDSLNYYPYKYINIEHKNKTVIKKIENSIGNGFEIKFKDFINKSDRNTFFSFFKDEDKIESKNNEDDLILSITKKIVEEGKEEYIAKTGNYVGKIVLDGVEININSRFSNIFLERMLNFANDVFVDDINLFGDIVESNFDFSKYIIFYMFIQNLEKSFLLGVPKSYQSIEHNEMKLKGKIDINKFIKKDIPFQGKISSTNREQIEIQEIIDTLYKAVSIIEKYGKNLTKNISHIKTHLKQNKSNRYVSKEIINKAINSMALNNPIFLPYKKVLKYAKIIIDGSNIEEQYNGDNETYGFLINVAELFEIYITKLIQNSFTDSIVESPKLDLYENMFYRRNIIPDIVVIQNNNVMVFDTKYKKMNMIGRNNSGLGDIDRNDFFQINTYMSYYQNKGYKVKVGGLLYPMERFEKDRCHNLDWLGSSNTKFIIDGVYINNEELSIDNIKCNEINFLNRIKYILES